MRVTPLLLLGLLAAPAPAGAGEPTAPAATRPFTPPVLVEKVPAEYPPDAFAADREGTVVLEFTVDEHGAVRELVIQESAGEDFDAAATTAIQKWRWQPGRSGDVPVPSRVTYSYHFTIERKPAPTPAEPPVRLRGQVLARGTRTPLDGVHVVALRSNESDPTVEAETDLEGRFALHGLPPGPVTLVVTGPGLVETRFEETLPPDAALDVRYFVGETWARRYQTTVRATPRREEVSRQTLTTEELVKLPGSFGDPLRAVENLPGVARPPFTIGLFIIRGGKPTDSRAFVGGSEVPQLYHFGGLRSIFPGDFFETVDYFPGNFGVRYGRSIAGAIDIDLRAGRRDRFHGFAEVNVFDAGVGVEGPLGKGSFILGARRSYVDAVLGVAARAGGLDGAPLSFTTAPVYYDYQAILDHPLWGGKVRVMFLGSDDRLRLLFDSPQGDPSIRGSFSTHIGFHRLQLRWTRTAGAWSFLVQNAIGYNGQDGRLGDGLNFAIHNFADDLRLEARWKMSPRVRFLFGVDGQLAVVRIDALVPSPPREGEQPLPLSVSSKYRVDDTLRIANVGLYAEAQVAASDKLTFTPGVRFDWFGDVGRATFNPRLGVRYQMMPRTTLRAGLGLYSQDPQPQDFHPVFGNPDLRPENAVHASVTVEQGLLPGLSLEATGFYKYLYDLVSASPLAMQRADGTVAAERLANTGEGRVYGGELLLRQRLSKWFFGWASYTVLRSERRDSPTAAWRLFDYDQTHILILALHVNLPRGFEVGTRFRYITGYPYTLVRGGYFDADGDVYAPGRFPTNTARYDTFHQLDFRVDKTFVFKRWVLKAYLDVTNIYNRPAEEQVQYSYDYKERTFIRGLPFLPSFGVRGEF